MVLRLTEAELVSLGERIGRSAPGGTFIAVRGELGAGKSTLARAIARGAGVRGPVPSPTFNLMFRYETPSGRRVAHLDLYRLERPEEVWDLGWAELPAEDEIVIVEWPERAEALLPGARREIVIRDEDDPERRRVELDFDPGDLPAPAR